MKSIKLGFIFLQRNVRIFFIENENHTIIIAGFENKIDKLLDVIYLKTLEKSNSLRTFSLMLYTK